MNNTIFKDAEGSNDFCPGEKAFINSLPKAGTNLLGKCLDLLGYTPRFALSSNKVLKKTLLAKYRRMLWGSYFNQGYLVGIDTPVEISKSTIHRKVGGLIPGQYCVGHIGYTEDILNVCLMFGVKPILIIRDPRAVISSFVPFVSKRQDHALYPSLSRLNTEEKYSAVLNGIHDGGTTLQPLRIRCNSIDPWLVSKSVLKVKFEDLVGEMGGGSIDAQHDCLRNICNWLGVDKQPVEYLSENLFGPGKHTFRSGRVDSWRDEIPKCILEDVNHNISDILLRWGYDRQ